MHSIRRAAGLHFTFEMRSTPSFSRLEEGKVVFEEEEKIIAFLPSTAEEYYLDPIDLEILVYTSSSTWVDVDFVLLKVGAERETIRQLVLHGLLICSEEIEGSNPLPTLPAWDSSALFYHRSSAWKGRGAYSNLPKNAQDVTEWSKGIAGFYDERTEEFGDPPATFHSIASTQPRTNLPVPRQTSALVKLFRSRKTTRLFDTSKKLELSQLSTVLYQVFGSQGSTYLAGNLQVVKKSSPSGGALHPIEVYPLVLSVNNVPTGLYHYHVGDHALEPMREMSVLQAREMAIKFTAGQNFFGTAQVLLLYTARFDRSFWKYRHHGKAYKVLQMDLGHLSQSLYLLCAEMGLGTFITGACNDLDMEEELQIDGLNEGALAIGGIGISNSDELTLSVDKA